MTYERINFVDQSVERPRTYEMTHNADGSITLTDSFGLVNELGTPINAETMNHIEDGIDSKQDQLIAGENIILENNVISAKSGSLPIGEIISLNCSSSYVPDGCLPCDGTEYTQAQFNDLWINYIETNYLNTCTYSEYESEIATYGQCAKFGVDADNFKFKVPTINKVIADVADTLGVRGNGIAIGLTGNDGNGEVSNFGLRAANIDNVPSGLFAGGLKDHYGTPVGYFDNTAGTVSNTPDLRSSLGLTTDASNSGIVTDVDKTYLELRYFVVVANGSINQSMMDWSAWSSSLQGKLNADHSNDTKPYVVETSDKSLLPSWYRIWSDGWCEQGGRSSVATATTTISLLKVFTDTNYNIKMTGSAGYPFITSRTIDTFIADTSAAATVDWEAKGYIN